MELETRGSRELFGKQSCERMVERAEGNFTLNILSDARGGSAGNGERREVATSCRGLIHRSLPTPIYSPNIFHRAPLDTMGTLSRRKYASTVLRANSSPSRGARLENQGTTSRSANSDRERVRSPDDY